MAIQFTSANHKYESVDDPQKEWLSVTTIISLFKPKFDKEAVANKVARNKKSKWYGLTPEEIVAIWDKENKRAIDLGSWYHDQRESELVMCNTIQRSGIDLPVIKPIEQDGVKLSPDQTLTPGIYPEHLVYLKSAGICGQADRVEVVGNHLNIYDYKTNKEIKMEGFTNWQGSTNMLDSPVNHLEDCNFNHYTLQLSLYMYMMLKHNHGLKPGIMQIHHVSFEKEDDDEYGYPIIKYDQEGNPIVKEVVPYTIPYLKKEVISIINYLKENPVE
jgi:hypothetical protein